MRQRIALVIFTLVIVASISSCKSREKCPTYSQQSTGIVRSAS
jgi:hypothetical protein